MKRRHEDYFIVEPPMGPGTRALLWALITFSVVTGAWTVGTLIYWLIDSIGGHSG